MQKVVFASNNKGKIIELKKILGDIFDIVSLSEVGLNIMLEENGKTFFDNGLMKAKQVYKILRIPVIADDSGLCVEALDGFPGVYTNRFLEGTDRQKNEYIMNKLKNKVNRTAKFECCLVYYYGSNLYLVGNGIIKGKISLEYRGSNGFGFDEIFELENGKTLAELTKDEKNEISARCLAAQDLRKHTSTY